MLATFKLRISAPASPADIRSVGRCCCTTARAASSALLHPMPDTTATTSSCSNIEKLLSLEEILPRCHPRTSGAISRSIAAMIAILLMRSPSQPVLPFQRSHAPGTNRWHAVAHLPPASPCSPARARPLPTKQTFFFGPFSMHQLWLAALFPLLVR